jgi:chromosome segregation ATPase
MDKYVKKLINDRLTKINHQIAAVNDRIHACEEELHEYKVNRDSLVDERKVLREQLREGIGE